MVVISSSAWRGASFQWLYVEMLRDDVSGRKCFAASLSYKAVLEYGAYCAYLWTQTLKKARKMQWYTTEVLYNENMKQA